jgi:uncharacterized membrane protein YkoI
MWIATFATVIGLGAAVSQGARADEKQEKIVSIDQIPAPARTALLSEAKGEPIRRVEIEMENGRSVYEGVVQKGSEEMGITVDAQGRVLGHHSEKKEHNK